MHEDDGPFAAPEPSSGEVDADEPPAADVPPSRGYAALVIVGVDLTFADYQSMWQQAAAFRSLARQLRDIVRCRPDDVLR